VLARPTTKTKIAGLYLTRSEHLSQAGARNFLNQVKVARRDNKVFGWISVSTGEPPVGEVRVVLNAVLVE